MERGEVWRRIGLLVLTIYVFLVSIKLMSASFKLMGLPFAESLISLTTNPFVGLFIGILATSIVQSSSVTTSIVVGLTASGSMTVPNAIPIIMGANIGTSITNMIVSLAHIKVKEEFRKAFEVATIHDLFNILAVIILFPLELIFHPIERIASLFTGLVVGSAGVNFRSPLDYLITPVVDLLRAFVGSNVWVMLAIALAIIFFSLQFFVRTIRPLAESEFKHLLHKHVFSKPLRSFWVGVGLTAMVQSSSVTTSLVVPLGGSGIVSMRRIFPYVLGANVGTTVTALLAAVVTGSPTAVTVALSHLIFNILGIGFVVPLREIPFRVCQWIGQVTLKSRVFPIAYIVGIFFVIPILVIWIFH